MAEIKKDAIFLDVKNADDVKNDFITIASHQLRTPMSAVRWSLETLLAGRLGELAPKQKGAIGEAYQSNIYMTKVVDDLLRVSRLDREGVLILPQFVSFAGIVNEVIARHKDFARASNCEIIFKAQKNLPLAYADPLQVRLVINALIDNAVRYGKSKGRVIISLSRAGDYLLFKIRDFGIGIPRGQQHLAYTKFFRAPNAVKIQTGGMGLDLYLAKKIVEASGGKINFTSQENKGTIFYVYLPTLEKQVTRAEVRQKQESVDALKKEREFVSITVHELKAPLGIAKWGLEILKSQKQGKLNNIQLDLIERIYRGNERLLVLVRDLLNLAKLQEGKFEIEPRRMQLGQVAADVISGFSEEAKKRRIGLEVQVGGSKLPKLLADPNRLAQVITNLVSNAFKYTPDGGHIIIKIEKFRGDQLRNLSRRTKTANIFNVGNINGYLVFSIKDSGIGISEQDQKQLFTRFFRSQRVLRTEAEGTGLGLYITKSIIERHHGDIWFTSQLGKGSTFYFSLPIN